MYVYRLECNNRGVFSQYLTTSPSDAIYSEGGCTVVSIRWGDWSPFRFACDSMDMLIEYFGSDFAHLLALAEYNVKVVEYKVRKNYVTYGENGAELVFIADKATERNVVIEGLSKIQQ